MTTNGIFTALTDEPGDRKTQWLRVQELARQWRENGDPLIKAEASDLLVKLMVTDALIKIKVMRVDADLPARLRHDYKEMAIDVASSVLANPNTRATAILEKHDPEKSLISTMVNFYLRNKIVDHLRAEKRQRNLGKMSLTDKAKAGDAAPQTTTDTQATPDESKEDPCEQFPDTTQLTADPKETPNAPRYQPSSMLADDAPGVPLLPAPDSTWDTAHEARHDLIKVLVEIFEPEEQEAVYYDLAGYTIDEASSAIGVSESTYKRRLNTAKAKFVAYHKLGG